jgi:hypothetical protein
MWPSYCYFTTSAKFRSFFVHGISYTPTDLSLLKGFSKNFSFEDFHNFQEIPTLCGTVVDRVDKSKLSHIPHNQYYPRVHTKKGY